MKSIKNRQIRTTWSNSKKSALVTDLYEKTLPPLKIGEVLVEILFVPIHGSFWLASNPKMTHPRIDEFMKDGGFVFGNGGVGKVIEISKDVKNVSVGDFVSIFGHTPCTHKNCLACYKNRRYVECDYGEGKIIGHGKNSGDGTYAKYTILPKYSYEVCFKKGEVIKKDILESLMYAFLLADVRNAITRNNDFIEKDRVVIFGAGQAGSMASYLILKLNPKAKVLIIDTKEEKLKNIKKINNKRITTYLLNEKNKSVDTKTSLIEKIILKTFKKKANLIFDASSGNTAHLWANTKILSENCLVIPFGFGSNNVVLERMVFQISGLKIAMSRGVGDLNNRKNVIEIIKKGAYKFINDILTKKSVELRGLDEAVKFIKKHQGKVSPPQAYIRPNT